MLVTAEARITRLLPHSRDHVWAVMSDPHPHESMRWVEGPVHGEVGCTYLLHLPATTADGLPALYSSTVTHISAGHMVTCSIVGPLLEQRENWTLSEAGEGATELTIHAWVRASAAVYEAEALHHRTLTMIGNAAQSTLERCQQRAA